jgi:hypothetical protein
MLNFYRRFLPHVPTHRHHYTPLFPAPESRAPIPLPGRWNFSRPSKSARRVCHVLLY